MARVNDSTTDKKRLDSGALPEEMQKMQQAIQPVESPKPTTTADAPINTTPPQLKNLTPTIIRDGDSGDITGTVLPNGKVIMGNSKEIREQMKLYIQKQGTIQGATEGQESNLQNFNTEQMQAKQDIINRNKQLSTQVGQTPDVESLEASPYDSNIIKIAGDVLPSAASSGLTMGGALAGGALAGTAVLPGVGTTTGALIGAGVGLTVSIYDKTRKNLAEERKKDISISYKSLTDGRRQLNRWILLANADPSNADDYLLSFNQQMYEIERAYGQLQLDTQTNTDKFLDAEGRMQLADFERFYSKQGGRDYYIAKMQEALRTPNPNRIDPEVYAEEAQNLNIDTN